MLSSCNLFGFALRLCLTAHQLFLFNGVTCVVLVVAIVLAVFAALAVAVPDPNDPCLFHSSAVVAVNSVTPSLYVNVNTLAGAQAAVRELADIMEANSNGYLGGVLVGTEDGSVYLLESKFGNLTLHAPLYVFLSSDHSLNRRLQIAFQLQYLLWCSPLDCCCSKHCFARQRCYQRLRFAR